MGLCVGFTGSGTQPRMAPITAAGGRGRRCRAGAEQRCLWHRLPFSLHDGPAPCVGEHPLSECTSAREWSISPNRGRGKR